MAKSRVHALVKFFGEESHADQFMAGKLFMRKLRYFQQLEGSEEGDGRPDRNEAVAVWHQPQNVELTIALPGCEPIKIGPDDLAGPVSISPNLYADMHVFCMSALSIPDPSTLEGDLFEVQAQLQAALQIDGRCLDFGPYAVIVNPSKFVAKLRTALQGSGHWHKAGLVEYYDDKTFHGRFAEADVPFRKQIKFDYQKEYRACIATREAGDEPLMLEIGDLSPFAVKLPSSEVNASLEIRLKTKDDQSSSAPA